MAKITRFKGIVFFTLGLAAITGCSKHAPQSDANIGANAVTVGDSGQDQQITDGGTTFRVLAKGALATQLSQEMIFSVQSVKGKAYLEKFISKGSDSLAQSAPTASPIPSVVPSMVPSAAPSVASSGTPTVDDTALVVGIPIEMIVVDGADGHVPQQYVFDGVITKVSDQNNTDLGDLKLTDLSPVHVETRLIQDKDGSIGLGLFGCLDKCTESSALELIQAFPVVGVDTTNGQVMIDLAPVGQGLDMMSELDPKGTAFHLKTVSSNTVSFDYSLSTLVFDVESHMIPTPVKDPKAAETVFTTRWFLRSSQAFNPAFEARPPTDGVGFFLTSRSKDTKITRWTTTSTDGDSPVHYYIKNVPTEFQGAFQSAFDEWNAKLKPIVGKDIFSYDFVNANDPRSALLVTGDPRYNIVEWDLVNKASYGGLGPSIANQFTGENLTANVLIQGPSIEVLYKEWFKVNAQAQALKASGQAKAADTLMLVTRHEIFDQLNDLDARPKLSLTKNGNISFLVHSQMPELADPLAERTDFEPLPTNMDYAQYMYGYFHDMLTHELGHNLGMRHNFKGNLGSTGNGQGEVSRSVMEYLNRDYRNFDGVDSYDLMALSYGYTGLMPAHLDWFCTDEDQATAKSPSKSAECTQNDATADPFSWYQERLAEVIDYLVNRGDKAAPTWTVDDLGNELTVAVQGMGFYASSAKDTGSTWTNFFTGGNRPRSTKGVKAYVVTKLKAQLCDSGLETETALKETTQAQAVVTSNVTALRAKVITLLKPLNSITADDLNCSN